MTRPLVFDVVAWHLDRPTRDEARAGIESGRFAVVVPHLPIESDPRRVSGCLSAAVKVAKSDPPVSHWRWGAPVSWVVARIPAGPASLPCSAAAQLHALGLFEASAAAVADLRQAYDPAAHPRYRGSVASVADLARALASLPVEVSR